jgi:hypothetical protein
VSDTPQTDAFVAQLEKDLGDGPPCISEAAIDVIVRSNLIEHARRLERELADKDTVPRSRYNVACEQYTEVRQKLEKLLEGFSNEKHDYRADPINQPENIR